MVVRQAQWPALESARKDHLRLSRENLRHQLNHVQHPLEMARICCANLQQVVGLTGQVMAFLDLVDADEVTRHVGCYGARDLLDEDKGKNTIAKHRRVNHGRVAADHTPSFELLYPLMGGRTAHPDGLAHLGVRLTPIALQQLKNPSVRLIDAFQRAHFLDSLSDPRKSHSADPYQRQPRPLARVPSVPDPTPGWQCRWAQRRGCRLL